MANRRITIQLKGDPSYDEHLRFHDFIAQLDAIRSALSHLGEYIAEPGSPPIQYRVVDLSHQSPATVVLEAVPASKGRDVSALVVDRFVNGIKHIKSGAVPEDFNYDLLQSFKRIGSFQKRLHKPLFVVTIAAESEKIDITESLESNIDRIIGPDEIVQGSISGTLELINIHANANTFRIYPVVGPKRVDCHFKRDELEKAVRGINHYVDVRGELRYKQREKFPYAINVIDIDVYPDDQDLPSIFDLKGIAPQATGDMKSEDFVRRLRDAEW